MRSKFMPMLEIEGLLQRKSRKLRQHHCHCYSMWQYDKENNKIIIYSTCPGYWIGKAGKDLEELTNQINAIINERNDLRVSRGYDKVCEPITIRFEECES